MRGKKVDTDFVSSFVKECIFKNKGNKEQIIEEASNQIKNIDELIIAAEKSKSKRSKLLDVLITLNK